MNRQAGRDEQLSALMDGELHGSDARAVVDDLRDDDESRMRWARFHLIGEAMRNGLPDAIDMDLARRVSAEVGREPAVLAPRSRRSRMARPLAGLAIAASVAMIAIVSVDSPRRTEDGIAPQVERVAQLPPRQPAAAAPRRVASLANFAVAPDRSRPRWNIGKPVVEKRLNSYLINHNEWATGGMRGMLPYVRIVGYETRD